MPSAKHTRELQPSRVPAATDAAPRRRLSADIAELQGRIETEVAPFADAVTRLDETPGVAVTAAQVIIAEIGLDMSRFPTPGHLALWAKFASGVKESAGRSEGNDSTGRGPPYLARVLDRQATDRWVVGRVHPSGEHSPFADRRVRPSLGSARGTDRRPPSRGRCVPGL